MPHKTKKPESAAIVAPSPVVAPAAPAAPTTPAAAVPPASPVTTVLSGAPLKPTGPGLSSVITTPQGDAQFVDLPLATFQQDATQLTALIAQMNAIVVNPTHYTPAGRKSSAGKLRDGEAPQLQIALNVARAYPDAFNTLGNSDDGVDPNTFEVDLVSDRLSKAALLVPIVEQLGTLAQSLSDCMLKLNETGARPAREAYLLAKAMAKSNTIIASMIASVVAYYSAIGKAAATTRAANKATAKKTEGTTPSPTPPAKPAGG
jgi:hypothetical protein